MSKTIGTRILAIGALAALVAASTAGASKAESLASLIADGEPWTSTTNNGRSMQFTFHPDGTAEMQLGPISRSLRWTNTSDGMCMEGVPGGSRCVTLVQTSGGYAGLDNGATVFTLSRN